jgi:hypothetical protein
LTAIQLAHQSLPIGELRTIPPKLIAIVTLGQQQENNNNYDCITGGLLLLGGGQDSRLLFFPNQWQRSQGLPLLHTLALVSDGIILLGIEKKKNFVEMPSLSFPQSLVDGWIHRVRIGSYPARVMIWSCPKDLPEDTALHSPMVGWSSERNGRNNIKDVVDRVDVVTDRMQPTVAEWTRELQQQPPSVHVVFGDIDAFDQATVLPLMIHEAYKRLGGQEEVLLGHAVAVHDIIRSKPFSSPAILPRGGGAVTTDAKGLHVVAAATANDICRELDALQDLLQENDLDESSMPVHFGKHAALIVDHLIRLEQQQDDPVVVADLQSRLESMHQSHTQSLRDYFGRLYEIMVDKNHHRATTSPRAMRKLQDNIIRSFRRAAQESIPSNIPDSFDLTYESALAGLTQDMKDSTDLRQDLTAETLAEEEEQEETTTTMMRHRWNPPQWLKSLTARAIMIAVNYAQGWLALQSIRHAALERERDMPKIPLF